MNFKTWYRYFLSNQSHFGHIDWTDTRPLTATEREMISSSVRQFQRGEYSEGKHFLQFARTMHDKNYVETIPLFIREEQDHSSVLGQFMEIHQIDKLKEHWLDDVFRGLRKLAGLEGLVTVLLTAEMISMVYYKALNRATGSVLLQKICKQILKDEAMHLRFQSYSLRVLYQRKKRIAVLFSALLHRILMAGTIVTVWCCHKKVVRAGGYHFLSFSRDVWKEFRKCKKMIRNERPCMPIFNDKSRQAKVFVDENILNRHHA
ncbi:MAG TPA: hypothetical protein VGO58_06845 [Chitinophagaceae bacterium]|nr:hypothetical protein [Chitinophagaceae bacterium]